MSNREIRVIPAEHLTQYARWEMRAIRPSTLSTSKTPAEAVAVVEASDERIAEPPLVERAEVPLTALVEPIPVAAPPLPTYEEGYATGLERGRQTASVEHQQEKQAVEQLLQNLNKTVQTLEEKLAEGLVATALRLAQHVTKVALAEMPERILPIVREAITHVPYLSTQPRLRLHPADSAFVESALSADLRADGWSVIPDPAISRGSCIIETAFGSMEATLEARWRRIEEALGGVSSPSDVSS